MNEAIANLIHHTEAEEAKWNERERKSRQEHAFGEARKRTELLPCLRRASPRDYKKWLKGYLARGGIPTHYYSYGMPDIFYVAERDFAIFPLFGSAYINIIVPDGIACELSEGTGHCSIFFMDGFRVENWGGAVPVYGNTVV